MKTLNFLAACVLFPLLPPSLQAENLTFTRDIQPILEPTCFPCHGEKKQKGKFRADQREELFKKTESGGAIVVPGQPANSDLMRRVTTQNEDDIMPPPGEEPRLTPGQIATIRTWVEQGALWSTDDKPAPPSPGASK